MYLSELVKKTEKELNGMKKADIVKCLVDSHWQYSNLERKVEHLTSELTIAKSPYNQAKLLVCGAASIKIEPISEYDSSPDLDDIDLCHSIGVLLGKYYELLSAK